jgi:Flp pilus assembly protein TadG
MFREKYCPPPEVRVPPSRIRALVTDESGVSLVIVAVQILVLTAMCTFVLDYGMVWLGRRQAQNAADAGALAAATALAKDDSTWAPYPAALNTVTNASGNGAAQANKVLGATPGTEALARCPAWMVAPNNINCVEVNVYRDGTHGSASMPVFFGRLIGQTSQSVKATATAQVVAATASGCMRPWFITDWYQDVNGNNMYDPGTDIYTFPGYDPDNVAPKPGLGDAVVFHAGGGPSSYGQLDVGAGGAEIRDAIQHCYEGPPFAIGQMATTKPGNTLGPEAQGISDLLSWDPDSGTCSSWPDGCVHWDPVKEEVVGGCSAAGTCVCGSEPCPYGGTQSPRIVQAAMCSPAEATCSGAVPGAGQVTIVNILSFFITGCNGAAGSCSMGGGGGGGGGRGGGGGGGSTLDIDAILVGSAGLLEAGPVPAPGKSFVTVQLLVR